MKILLVILVFSFPVSMSSQSPKAPEQAHKKNAFYISGDWMTTTLTASLNYERAILTTNSGLLHAINGSVAYGRWLTVSSKGSNYNIDLHFISGLGNQHAELTMGLRCTYKGDYFYSDGPTNQDESWSQNLSYLPLFTFGYRYQKPGGRFLFRASTGIPFFQFSMGYLF